MAAQTTTATVDETTFSGANVVSFEAKDFAALAAAGTVTATLTLQGDTNGYYTQAQEIKVAQEATSVSGAFTVDYPGTYTVTLTGAVNGSASATAIVADSTMDGYWAQGKVATNQKADVDGTYYFDYTGAPVDLSVTGLTTWDYQSVDPSGYQTVWYKDTNANGDFDALADTMLNGAPSDAGSYFLTVWPAGSLDEGFYAPVSKPIVLDVEVLDQAEVEYSLYQVNASDDYDVSDTTFVYDGTTTFLNADGTVNGLGLAIDGVPVDSAFIKNDSDFGSLANTAETGTYYNLEVANSVKDAKTYTVKVQSKDVVKGTSVSSATEVANVRMTVLPFDFSQAVVTMGDVEVATEGTAQASKATFEYEGVKLEIDFSNAGASTTVVDTDKLSAGDLKLTVDSFAKSTESTAVQGYLGYFGYWGEYGVSIAPANAEAFKAKSNFAFAEPAAATVRAAKELATSFKYDSTAFGTGVNVDLTKGESFDPEKINWTVTSFNGGQPVYYNGENATVTVYKDGEAVSAATAPGTYTVVVSVTADRAYSFAGSGQFTLTVKGPEVKAADVTLIVEGKVVTKDSTTAVEYDGQPVEWSVVVRDTETETVLEQGSDYKVELRDLDANEVVDEIVNAGRYAITVSDGDYAINGGPIVAYVQVNGASFDGFEVVEQAYGYDPAEYELPVVAVGETDPADYYVAGIPYTGSTIQPAVRAYVEKTVNGKQVRAYTDLDPAMYELSYTLKGERATEVKDKGEYTAKIATTKAFTDEFGAGATIVAKDDTFQVIDSIKAFMDVKPGDWYADESTKARQMGYMNGLGESDMLMGASNITRADMAIVLMRMAGGNPGMSQNETYPTPFSDVEADAYYAKAIDWAYKAGIVQGFEGSFRPNDFVSREELATMVARFAEKAMGQDVSAQADLAAYTDGASVSEFAKASMAWCVEAGIFGVGTDVLNPQGTAQRAEVAAISVRLMPAEEL